MKSERIFKDFSALSFEAGRVEAEGLTAVADSPPRLTPDSVRDFNVQHDGAAHGDSPENDGRATTRHWQQRVLLLLSNDPAFQVAVRRALPQQIELMPVRHAVQAVRLFQKSFIDAALLDLDLDDCEGWRTAERLLADDPTARLLLAVKTKARLDLIAGITAGLVLEKSVNAAQVLEMFNALLCQSKHQRFQHNVSLHNFLRYAQPLRTSRTTSNRHSGATNE